MDAIEKYTHNGWIIEICLDTEPMSPREWDNLGTMVCSHSRYDLGDIQVGGAYKSGEPHFGSVEEVFDFLQEENPIYLPLYLYDHSGITMNTGGFSDPWDSGQVGFIYVTREKIKEEYGWKVITKARREKIEQYLRGEVEEYDQYLTGEVYGYRICDPSGDCVDSCWGFYGEMKYCLQEAINCVPDNPPEDAEEYEEELEDLEEV